MAEVESSPVNGLAAITVPLGSDQPHQATLCALGLAHISLRITCADLDLDRQMAQICCQASLLSNVEHLDIRADRERRGWKEDDDVIMDNSVTWRPPAKFFHSFPTPAETRRMLHFSGELGAHGVAPALEGEGVDEEMIREALSELRMISALESRRPLNTLPPPATGSYRVAQDAAFPLIWDDTYYT
jgi:hypothetical protein